MTCYNYLEKADIANKLKPEEALALLDSQFGDEKVRLFAVKKLSKLDDYMIALYMPQLVQSLKSELYHRSPLSEFLLERSIRNTGVVGHALFWTLKSSLHSKLSYERLYLILERFLMCCGSFKNNLFIQTLASREMVDTCRSIQHSNESLGKLFDIDEQKGIMRDKLKMKSAKKIKLEIELFIKHQKYDDIDGYTFNLAEILDYRDKEL